MPTEMEHQKSEYINPDGLLATEHLWGSRLFLINYLNISNVFMSLGN